MFEAGGASGLRAPGTFLHQVPEPERGDPMRHPRTAALTASIFTALAIAPAAHAAPATINWQDPSDTTTTVNQGESVTWNVVESGHNIDVISGPEKFQSTSGKDAKGTQFSHVFNTPGTYKFICDYH